MTWLSLKQARIWVWEVQRWSATESVVSKVYISLARKRKGIKAWIQIYMTWSCNRWSVTKTSVGEADSLYNWENGHLKWIKLGGMALCQHNVLKRKEVHLIGC